MDDQTWHTERAARGHSIHLLHPSQVPARRPCSPSLHPPRVPVFVAAARWTRRSLEAAAVAGHGGPARARRAAPRPALPPLRTHRQHDPGSLPRPHRGPLGLIRCLFPSGGLMALPSGI
jgi:hypothetical protein